MKWIQRLIYIEDHEVIREKHGGETVYRRGAPIKINRITRALKRFRDRLKGEKIVNDKKTMYEQMRKLIEEGKLNLTDNTSLIKALRKGPILDKRVTPIDGNFVAVDPAFEPPKPLFVKVHYGQVYLSDLPDNPQVDDEMLKRITDLFGTTVHEQFLSLQPPVTNFSTASSKPIDPPLTLDILKEALKQLPSDPLLEKGVMKDWVCVINPRLVKPLEDFYELNKPKHFDAFRKLDYVLGRRTFIINEAPINIEYMPESVMRMKYAEHFLRELELLAKLKDEEDNSVSSDNSPSEG